MKQSLQLQDKELRYLQDTDFLSTKLRLMKDLQGLLEQAQLTLQQHKNLLSIPAAVWEVPPKISRGENYRSLPYLVLDYPRIFQQETTFAYRSMFWWGHGFSCTLHLGGAYWQQYQPYLLQKLARITPEEMWVCVHTTPWEYHYQPDNYIPLQEYLQQANALEKLATTPFFKISRRISLEQYQQLPQLCLQTLQTFTMLLH